MVRMSNEKIIGNDLKIFDVIDSTNLYAKQHIDELSHGSVVMSGRQTHGRGRRGRVWNSSDDGGLYMTIVLKNDINTEFAMRYVIATAIGMCKAVNEYGANAAIKWPNDIVKDGKKMCGILLEMVSDSEHKNDIIVGIGLNVLNNDFDEELKKTATSLFLETGKNYDKNDVAKKAFEKLDEAYKYCVNDFDKLLCEYKNLSDTLNKQVRILELDGKERISGEVIDFDEYGRIVLKDYSGNIHHINSGDVSLRRKE